MSTTLIGTVLCEDTCGFTARHTRTYWDGDAFAIECPDCPAKARLVEADCDFFKRMDAQYGTDTRSPLHHDNRCRECGVTEHARALTR